MSYGNLPQGAIDALAELENRNDPSIIGLVLSGSAARGMATQYSDVDVIVVRDENSEETKRTVSHSHFIDEIPESLSDLETVRPLGSEGAWDRWSYAYARILRDTSPNQRVTAAVRRLPVLDDTEIRGFLTGGTGMLDCFLNFSYRTLKSHRDGRPHAARLDSAEGIGPFLDVIFALAGRVRPYNKYLTWELREHPFKMEFPDWQQDYCGNLRRCIDGLLDGEEKPMRDAFRAVEYEARAYEKRVGPKGLLTAIIEDWHEDALQLMRGSSHPPEIL